MWEQGNNASLKVPGKYFQQISPEIVSKEGSLPGTITYRFWSDELCNLAAMMFWNLAPEDVCKLVDTQMMENFPCKAKGMYLHI